MVRILRNLCDSEGSSCGDYGFTADLSLINLIPVDILKGEAILLEMSGIAAALTPIERAPYFALNELALKAVEINLHVGPAAYIIDSVYRHIFFCYLVFVEGTRALIHPLESDGRIFLRPSRPLSRKVLVDSTGDVDGLADVETPGF